MHDMKVSLDEIARLRAENRERVERKIAHVRFREICHWFEEAAQLSRELVLQPDLRLGGSGPGLLLGSRWAGLIVAGTAENAAHAWFNEIEGEVADNSPIIVRQGAGELSAASMRRLMRVCRATPTGGFVSVPDRCYDGAPTTIRVHRASEMLEVSANASDSGPEPAVALAKLIWSIKMEIRMKETQRYVPPSER